MKFQKQFEKICRMTRLEIGLRGNDRRMTVLILAQRLFSISISSRTWQKCRFHVEESLLGVWGSHY